MRFATPNNGSLSWTRLGISGLRVPDVQASTFTDDFNCFQRLAYLLRIFLERTMSAAARFSSSRCSLVVQGWEQSTAFVLIAMPVRFVQRYPFLRSQFT